MIVVTNAFISGKNFIVENDVFDDFSSGSGVRRLFVQFSSQLSLASIVTSAQNDVLIYDGNYAYRDKVVSFGAGAGNDIFVIGAGPYQYVGSVNVDMGEGDDRLVVNSLQGNITGTGGLFRGGDGHDIIEIRADGIELGIFSNSPFIFLGDGGNDRFVLNGQQVNVLNSATGGVVDGGSGFDTLTWNLRYQLSVGGQQIPIVGVLEGTDYAQEITARDIERLILEPLGDGLTVRFAEQDVASITAGSDFDRSQLGLEGVEGRGTVLFLESSTAPVAVDLEGWARLGTSIHADSFGYAIFGSGDGVLVIDPLLLQPGMVPEAVFVDRSLGGVVLAKDLFPAFDDGSTFLVTDESGATASYASFDVGMRGVRVLAGEETPEAFTLRVTKVDLEGNETARLLAVSMSELSFRHTGTAGNRFETAAVGDVNGDGVKDIVGAVQGPEGHFSVATLESQGLSKLFENGRAQREARLVDLDNDGDLDLIANTYAASQPGPNVALMYLNDGTGFFAEVESFANMNIQGYGETIVAADFNNDQLTDLYIPYYFRNDPDGQEVAGSRLLINIDGGEFEDQTEQWDVLNSDGSLSLAGFGLGWDAAMPEGAQSLDFNRDGFLDLYVGNHLFINQGNAFFDANRALGLPVEFEEGASFFDWNNDSYLDLLLIRPEKGPELYEFDADADRFELANVFPEGRIYSNTYGLSVGDLDGDGWDDVYLVGGAANTPRLYLNQNGENFVEYRSDATASLLNYAGPVIDDLDGDGRLDMALGGSRGVLINASTTTANPIRITLLGPGGERNQYGRIVQLAPDDESDERVLTRIVDGGSGYMAQRDYTLTFTDAKPGSYMATAYVVDYPSGLPVALSFQVQTGGSYEVYAANGAVSARVKDIATGEFVSYNRQYASIPGDDVLDINLASVPVDTGEGRDRITLNGAMLNDLAGVVADGGAGSDVLTFDGSNAYTTEQLRLS
ncbi:FG-GAP repeat domain-containing protein, partial [Aromatoleum diolicum]